MVVYFDANIIQYCADYEDSIFGDETIDAVGGPRLRKELIALRRLVGLALKAEEMEVANRWHVAAPSHLMKELLAGKPTVEQRSVYSTLSQAWDDSEWRELMQPAEERVWTIEKSLRSLHLKHEMDRWHLAEAIAIEASWFLTCDKDILKKTRKKPTVIGVVQGVRVARPSECVLNMTDMETVFGG